MEVESSVKPGAVKYLVTGATGFLGSHLVSLLRARGHEVVPFSRSSGGDVLDAAAVRKAAAGCDGAFHCAGKVSRDENDAEELYLASTSKARKRSLQNAGNPA
jgi:nucleoside-diphosphate-sugar epimerase